MLGLNEFGSYVFELANSRAGFKNGEVVMDILWKSLYAKWLEWLAMGMREKRWARERPLLVRQKGFSRVNQKSEYGMFIVFKECIVIGRLAGMGRLV